MNSQLHQYPAALYSSVSEVGYRAERYTGETLRSGKAKSERAQRRRIFERLRQVLSRDGSRRNRGPVVVYPMHEAR